MKKALIQAVAVFCCAVVIGYAVFFLLENRKAKAELGLLRKKYQIQSWQEKRDIAMTKEISESLLDGLDGLDTANISKSFLGFTQNKDIVAHWHNANALAQFAVANQHWDLALQWIKEYPYWFGVDPIVQKVRFMIVRKKSYIMFTTYSGKKNFLIKVNKDYLEDSKLYFRNQFIDLAHWVNFLSTLRHELRHVRQYAQNVHFEHSGDDFQEIFWAEQARETDPRINTKSIVNARMECDAYMHQILMCDMTEPYKDMLVHRLKTWYTPVIEVSSLLKRDVDTLVFYSQYLCK